MRAATAAGLAGLAPHQGAAGLSQNTVAPMPLTQTDHVRAYWPQEAIADGSWTSPAVEKVNL
jgi:hypothetical protein